MIIEGFRVLIFGMLGIFIVMGFIIAAILLLNHYGKGERRAED